MHAVIMAGGRGTRFWPRSREKKPKHLLDIVSDRTIIQETVDRIKPLIKPKNILIVTGRKHARELMKQLPEVPAKNILIEPVGRNTAACIGLAAVHIQKKAKDDVMVVLPSDHAIGNPENTEQSLPRQPRPPRKKMRSSPSASNPPARTPDSAIWKAAHPLGRLQAMRCFA